MSEISISAVMNTQHPTGKAKDVHERGRIDLMSHNLSVPSFDTLLYEKRNATAYVTLNRPEVMNALNQKAIAELRAAFEDAQDDAQIRSVIITGVELSAELSRLFELVVSYGDTAIRDRLSLTLLESGPRVLPTFPPEISASSQQRLENIGLRVLTLTAVASAEPGGFRYGDGKLAEADLMVWAAGVKAPDFMNSLAGLETNRANQIVVSRTLQVLHDEQIFALGECASLTPGGAQRPLPPTAQVATQRADYWARHLPEWFRQSKPLPGFVFRDSGSLVSVSDYDAPGTRKRFGFFPGGLIRGRLAQFSHGMLHRRRRQAMHGFRTATLLWTAEQVTELAQPNIRLA